MGIVRKVRNAAAVSAAVALLTAAAAPGAAHADDIRDRQWQLTALHASDAWPMSTGNGSIVAVIDSGVDADHPDLRGQVLPGADFVKSLDGTGGDGTDDPVGHGTSVAALIAGQNDADGVVGLAYGAKILPVRVLDEHNRYDDAGVVARAVRWAVDHGANVINMSLGGVGTSVELADAITYALNREVVVVACTGNIDTQKDDSGAVWFPARMPGVVAVTGLSPNGEFWDGALSGPPAVLAAPADGLTSAHPDGYWNIQGTSFASPLVAATAALVHARFPEMTAANVINRLIYTAADLGKPGRDDVYGFGRVNPAGALAVDVPAVTANPLLTSMDGGGGVQPQPTDTPVQESAPAGESQAAAAPEPGTGSGPAVVLLIAVAVIAGAALTTTIVVLHRKGHRRAPGMPF